MPDDDSNPSPAHKTLTESFSVGMPADYCRPDDPDDLRSLDENSWRDRTIEADFLARQLASEDHQMVLKGARVVGALDLSHNDLKRNLVFERCLFSDRIEISGTKCRRLEIRKSWLLKGATAQNLRVDEDFRLVDSHVIGSLNLEGARIEATVDLRNSTFTVSSEFAISLAGARIDGSLRLDACKIDGSLRLSFITVGARLLLEGASVKGSHILEIDRRAIRAAIMAEHASIHGPVRLSANDDRVRGTRRRFEAQGFVSFFHANIGGNFFCEGGRLLNEHSIALTLEKAKIGGAVLLRYGTEVQGSIRLFAAEIGDALECDGCRIDAKKVGAALSAERLRTGGPVFLRNGFVASGSVNLVRAAIGGGVDCHGGNFSRPEPPRPTVPGAPPDVAFSIEEAEIGGNVYLSDEFNANGRVQLRGARVNGRVILTDGQFRNLGGWAIDGFNLWAQEAIVLSGSKIEGILDLEFARTTVFDDDRSSWPARLEKETVSTDTAMPHVDKTAQEEDSATLPPDPLGSIEHPSLRSGLLLEGLTYEVLYSDELDWKSRVEWLKRQADYRFPQPFLQLAKVYRAAGRDRDARKISIARNNAGLRPWNIWRQLLRLTVGFGYEPLRALLIALLFFVAGYFVYNNAAHKDLLAPTKSTSPPVSSSDCRPSNYPCVHPLAYSADMLMPVIGLKERDYWTPDTTKGISVAAFTWMANAVGWILGLLVIAGFTNVVRRE